MRTVRTPIAGDKHASRHGQKGTVGACFICKKICLFRNLVLSLFFMNPYAFSLTRMIIAQVLDYNMGKTSVNLGMFSCLLSTLSPSDLMPIKLAFILENLVTKELGDEILYNGITGEQLNVRIAMGPTYYQRLSKLQDDLPAVPRLIRTSRCCPLPQ